MSNAKLVSLAIAVFFFAATYIALGYSASSPPADARKIMDDVYRQDTSRDATMRATLEVFDKEGQGRKKRFTCRRIGPTGDSKTLVVFSDPEEIRGVALLSINQQGVRDRQFIYTPTTQRVRSVVTRERSARFIGSDFSYEDLAEPVRVETLEQFSEAFAPCGFHKDAFSPA